MTAVLLDGKQLAARIRNDIKQKITHLVPTPHLAVILVGNDDASKIYVHNKLKAAAETGIKTTLYTFDGNVSETELCELISKLNLNSDINGIMMQLPLPKHLNELKLLNLINPEKDVDGFHPINIGKLQNGTPGAVIAATPKGILRLLEETHIDFAGKHAVIIGRSQIVGKPAAMLLLNKDCTVTICHSLTQNLSEIVKSADILVTACGCPQLVKANWVKNGACVVDVGINRIDGKLCGDVDFIPVAEKVAFITPVPGGVGPMTIAMLLENTYEAYLKQTKS